MRWKVADSSFRSWCFRRHQDRKGLHHREAEALLNPSSVSEHHPFPCRRLLCLLAACRRLPLFGVKVSNWPSLPRGVPRVTRRTRDMAPLVWGRRAPLPESLLVLLLLATANWSRIRVSAVSGNIPGHASNHRGWYAPAHGGFGDGRGGEGGARGDGSNHLQSSGGSGGRPPASSSGHSRPGDWPPERGGPRRDDNQPPWPGQQQPPPARHYQPRHGGPSQDQPDDRMHRQPPPQQQQHGPSSYGGPSSQPSHRQSQHQHQQPPQQYPPSRPSAPRPQPPSGGQGLADFPPVSTEDKAKNAFQEHTADYSNVDKEKIFRSLWSFYRKRVLPLEIAYQYEHFEGKGPMAESDFLSKPMVLLLGPYSVGKTSFIRSLIKCDFPGQRIGPEPTTDRFMAIMHGKKETLLPGHAAVLQTDKPFSALSNTMFGSDFLNRFEVAEVPSTFLKEVMLIDTPGILSGEKQRQGGRGYIFEDVVRWFAERADKIIIMFDAHKLDISDELRRTMESIREHLDKIRILLNKADSIDAQQLMRVYGALMWQLGKVVNTPEPSRVYISSFWENTIRNTDNRKLLEREKHDLLKELHNLPNNAVNRKINELYKRIRSVRMYCFLIHHLRKKMPKLWGQRAKQHELLGIDRLMKEMSECVGKTKYRLARGDLPNPDYFKRKLETVDLRKFEKLDKSRAVRLDQEFSDYLEVKLAEATIKDPPSGGSRRG